MYMNYVHYYGFVLDKNKAEENKEKHKISFEVAVHFFNNPFLCEFYDVENSEDEDRCDYIVSIMGTLIVFVVATDRNDETRIISARKATKKEKNYYYESIEKIQG